MSSARPDCAPVFLVGAPRSGTSLLYKALSLHPRAAYISNWVHRFPRFPQLALLDRMALRAPERRHRAWFPSGNAYAPGQARAPWERLIPSPGEGEPVFARAGIGTEAVTELPPVGPEIEALRDAFAAIQRWGDGDVLFVKRIANNRRIPLLRAAFPGARYVELVRDPRAVALSLTKVDWWPAMRLWWLGQTPPEWVAKGGDERVLGAKHWRHEVDALHQHLADVPVSQRLTLRYEDLVADPGAELRRVAGFSGLDPDDADWVASLARMSFPDRNEAWRNDLRPEQARAIDSVAAEALDRYGYEPWSRANG